MVYAIDILSKIMSNFGGLPQTQFQRDGYFHMLGTSSIGQMNCALTMKPENIPPWSDKKQAPEILLAKTALNEKGELVQDKKYFKPILFGTDTRQFTLEDAMQSAVALGRLKDDGNLRMISHGESYHSHKYGYAADGIDVHARNARIIDRSRYLQMMRQKEDEFWQNIFNIRLDGDSHDLHSSSLNYPDCIILTPTLMASYPRAAVLEKSQRDTFWNKNTQLNHGGDLVRQWYIPENNIAPFGVHITVNHHFFSSENQASFNAQRKAMEEQTRSEIEIVSSSMAEIASFVSRLNETYTALSRKKAA